jgi:hypothetical protein
MDVTVGGPKTTLDKLIERERVRDDLAQPSGCWHVLLAGVASLRGCRRECEVAFAEDSRAAEVHVTVVTRSFNDGRIACAI